jgi:hypothetical protein
MSRKWVSRFASASVSRLKKDDVTTAVDSADAAIGWCATPRVAGGDADAIEKFEATVTIPPDEAAWRECSTVPASSSPALRLWLR